MAPKIQFDIYTISVAFLFLLARSQASDPSPSASADLICHTNVQSDCYPRIFQPSASFQRIHDDQDLPPGLHIRLNLETGLKEARLNVPLLGEDKPETELAAVPIQGDDAVEEEWGRRSLVEQSGKTPPAYSNDGKIQEPPAASGESEIFSSSVSTILSPISNTEVISAALDKLEDLAHEIYWGVEIAKDEVIVRKLVSLLEDDTSAAQAALVLGSAVQNNAIALAAALSHFDAAPGTDGPLQMVLRRLNGHNDPKLAERLLYLLGAMMRGGKQREEFVRFNALSTLIEVFRAEGAGKDTFDGVRGRIALILMDNFFDDEMRERSPSQDEPALLQSEDSHVMTGLQTEHAIMSSEIKTVKMLEPWCRAFVTALESWKGEDASKLSAANARVDDAYKALRNALAHQKIDC